LAFVQLQVYILLLQVLQLLQLLPVHLPQPAHELTSFQLLVQPLTGSKDCNRSAAAVHGILAVVPAVAAMAAEAAAARP
jgi:hypothetical protein